MRVSELTIKASRAHFLRRRTSRVTRRAQLCAVLRGSPTATGEHRARGTGGGERARQEPAVRRLEGHAGDKSPSRGFVEQ